MMTVVQDFHAFKLELEPGKKGKFAQNKDPRSQEIPKDQTQFGY